MQFKFKKNIQTVENGFYMNIENKQKIYLKNHKIKRCLIDQAIDRLKSGSCLIDQEIAWLKSVTARLVRPHNCFRPPSLLVEGLLSTKPTPYCSYLLVEMGLLYFSANSWWELVQLFKKRHQKKCLILMFRPHLGVFMDVCGFLTMHKFKLTQNWLLECGVRYLIGSL